MPRSDQIILNRYQTPEQAHLARAKLEGNGIAANVEDDLTIGVDWLYANAIGGIKLVIDPGDESAAREILELPPLEDTGITCPECKSPNIHFPALHSWQALMLLILGFLIPGTRRKAVCQHCGHRFSAQFESNRDLTRSR